MKDIPPKVLKTFERIKKSEEGCIELKKIKGRYYVYRATSEWDKEDKKVRKITVYLGSITPEGMYVPKKQRVQESKREVFEYANGMLAYRLLDVVGEKLKEYTPHHRELIAAAIIKALDPKPLRLISSRWEKLYLQKVIDVNLSPKNISKILRDTGKGVGWWYDFFEELSGNDLLLYDLTSVFTHSKNIRMAEKGYNNERKYCDQLGVVIAFSVEDMLPTGIEVYWGSMKDITTIKDFLERFGNRKRNRSRKGKGKGKRSMGFILDRGFWSEKLIRDFRREGINYVVPLRKNSELMDTRWLRWRKPFTYGQRTIKWSRKKTELGQLYFFYDPQLRGEEETALLRKVEQGVMTMEEFEERKKVAGVIGLLSNLERSGEDMFDLYKGREDVEIAFDAMKNSLDADSIMHTDEAVRGYFFVTLLALRIYFSVLKRLRERELTNKVSVEEVFFELSKVQKIVEPNREYFARIPKRARRIMELFPELPMG